MRPLRIFIAVLLVVLIGKVVVAQQDSFLVNFDSGSQYIFFGSPLDNVCPAGCQIDLSGQFVLDVAVGEASIRDASIELSDDDGVTPEFVSGDEVEMWLENILLRRRSISDDAVPLFAFELAPPAEVQIAPLGGTFLLDFAIGAGGVPQFGTVTGGPFAQVTGSSSFDFQARATVSPATSAVPEPTGTCLIGMTLIAMAIKRRRGFLFRVMRLE